MYIHYHFRHFSNDHPNAFKTQSTWSPPLPDNPNLLSYIASVAESIQRVFKHNAYNQPSSNLNENEMSFLTNYNIHNQEYVIKPADKGGAIVIWSTTDYEKEALSQLNDNKYYEKIQAQPDMIITAQTNTITNYVKDLFKFGDIDYKTLKYLLPPSPPRIPIFYLLPKIHKPNNPGRPIISGCDSSTDRLSSFIDTHLKPLCSSLPSYIKDTNHFLQTIFNITTPLPPNTILATIDVKSLYTNIPHDEGIHATLEALYTKHGRMWPLRKVIHQFLIHILKENYFTFNDQHSMILDTTVYVTPQKTLATTLYIKPTDRMPLLHQSSHHPETCKKGLIYSQMLRYRRIITSDKEFQENAQNLRVALIGRGYKDKDILPHINKASYTQSQLLINTTPKNNTRTLPFVIPYNPDLAPLSHILTQHWHYIENDPVLSRVWLEQPVIAYQHHKNLKEHFVRTKFTQSPTLSHQHHMPK